MSSHYTTMFWRRSITGQLRLRVADSTLAGLCRGFDVPAEIHDLISHNLTGPDGVAPTDDPAGDLIRLESRLRLRATQLENTTARLRQAIDAARADLNALTDRGGRTGLRERQQLSTYLGEAADELTAGVARLEEARCRIRAVREFVIALAVPDGVLAQARVGWQRDPTRPAFVSMYTSEAIFSAADPHRAPSTGRGGLGVAGEQFGVGWRRDGDDDDPTTDAPAIIGPWQLAYLAATGEVYATRRCHYLAEQVWLLGRGFTDPDRARRLLADLKQHHMLEPNSLIHAAHTLHQAADTGSTPTSGEGGIAEQGWG